MLVLHYRQGRSYRRTQGGSRIYIPDHCGKASATLCYLPVFLCDIIFEKLRHVMAARRYVANVADRVSSYVLVGGD